MLRCDRTLRLLKWSALQANASVVRAKGSGAAAGFARANAVLAAPGATLGGSIMARGGVNYIPRPDGDFNRWATHYYDAVKDWWTVQGLDANDLKPLEMALAEWNGAFPAHVRAAAAAEVRGRARIRLAPRSKPKCGR